MGVGSARVHRDSDRLAGTQVIAMLNMLFDAQAKAIAGHGGEIR